MVYRKLLTSPKERAKKHFQHLKRGEVTDYFQKCSFGAMPRSISRLTASVEVVCREMFRELIDEKELIFQ